MLPFEKNNGQRKFQCFVCGKTSETYEDYKTHIIDNHEISRHYVLCPLARCNCPVRDAIAHMRVKHPNEPIPKTGQLKATIWKDQGPKGKLKQRKPRFRTGYFSSTKNGGKDMHYRSGMECDVYECLEGLREVISYSVEPFSVSYSFEGQPHQYNPDLSVNFADGHTEIWEIKPANQTHLPKNNAKWVACNQHCQMRGYNFLVLTEVGLSKLQQQLKNESKS